jgi:nicotinamide mononucleotide adenylyltransferase
MSVELMVTALFPIKGQPPHIGHILTLVRIYDEYDQILVRIIATPGKYYDSNDFIIPPENVASIFREIFKHMPKIEVIVSREHLRDMKSINHPPFFDVIVSGNKRFLEGVKHLKPVRYVPRSQINGFNISGEKLRELMRSNKNQRAR